MEQTPSIPDNTSDLEAELRSRQAEHVRAIELALRAANEAETQRERDHWFTVAWEMEDVRDKFIDQFPEIFRENDYNEGNE